MFKIDKKNRCLALKTSIPSSEKSEDDNAEGSDAKNLNFLVRRSDKFLEKKKNSENITFQPKKNLKKHERSSSIGFTCFECRKTGPIKVDCPIYQKKKQQGEKKNKGSFKKKKKAYISWDDNKSTTSSDSSEEEEANLCLMGNNEVGSKVSIFYSEVDDNYDQLLDAFNEIHQEAQQMFGANNLLKGKLRWHMDKLVEIK